VAYIGKTPTVAPLTSSDIADDIITLAKMAGGTDGNIITYDASGNPAVVATGTDGQVLTSTGAGSPPAFEAVSGGDLVKITSTNFASSAASQANYNSSLITSTYKVVLINFNNVSVQNDAEDIYLQLSGDNGSSFFAITQCRGYAQVNQSSTVDFHYGSYDGGSMDHDYHVIGQDMEASSSGGGMSGTAWIYGISDANAKKYILSNSISHNSNGNYYIYYNASVHDTTSAINYIRILNGNGNNMDAGTVEVYGYK